MNANETLGMTPEQIAEQDRRVKVAEEAAAMADPDVVEPDDVDGQAAGAEVEVLNPISGELVDVKAMDTNDLAVAINELDAYLESVRGFRQAFADEAIGRLDRRNKRKVLLEAGELRVELETNAPTSAEYDVEVLEAALLELVKAGKLEAPTVDDVITWTKPAAPEKRVAKVEVNKLAASDDPVVKAAVAKARRTVNNNRSLKLRVKRKDADA